MLEIQTPKIAAKGTTRAVELPSHFPNRKTADSTHYLDIIESQQLLIEHLTHLQRYGEKPSNPKKRKPDPPKALRSP